ncbi:phosphotransferase family protein [Gordonia sp. Z-3]|uniref:Phosphotransferase family protein n=2 Tax=Gordonia TaxID=2053 RepID=A0A9X3D2I2_9ACTN|nr:MULTISPECIES: phosphotransferase family protein [Gordonia]MAU81353.1 acyl-CoA dehydrogenase [Gordonia sp. (in: high G+C Gram-positive bacteria)]MCF3938118.1 phosphotransferase family protein [Gordonia tangerina]MCX2963665.1 phosphotransferase family protein [Gordonia aquimaris]MED5802193.1 phosphotransferase family protein [Gordonia sp. Z-3]
MSEHPALDSTLLRDFLVREGVGVVGDLRVDLISGGKSNLTFSVRDDESHWVVRRPPTSGLTPSAHDMNREWAVTSALQSTDVPVAPAVAIDSDGEVLGAPFTVVEFVDGRIIRTDDDLTALSDDEIDRNVDGLVDTLVRLHAVDFRAVGLGDFGRPDGFAARQVKLWARQWGHVKTRDLDDVDRLVAELSERIPAEADTTIVHGDYRVDNTILSADDPGTVRAVVDWEMSTLGDPLTDIALMCVYRRKGFDRVVGFDAAWTSDRYPSADDMAQRYATRTGGDLGDWDFYLALANLKLGVIAEGITYRARAGAASDGADRAAEATGDFISAGLSTLRGKNRV